MVKVTIGKQMLEVLTTGMYPKSMTIYREYIQNAADSIRHAVEDKLYTDNEEPSIDIEFDSMNSNSIKITDNGYGIKSSEIEDRLLSIADSEKDEDKDMGYRGIGRLCGLAYCDKLIFRTTYFGEDCETTVSWDASRFRTLLDNADKISPEDVINKTVEISTTKCEPEKHYFIVELQNIVQSARSELLNEDKIQKYIAETSPVDFLPYFTYKEKIYRFAAENGFSIPLYNVTIEGKPVFKLYKTKLYEKSGSAQQQYDKITDVAFKIFKAQDGQVLAWMWYGICGFDRQIPACNDMCGIRLRRHNIEIGDESTVREHDFHKEKRGNNYFVGEVYLVHKELRPNNRRDYIRDVSRPGTKGNCTVRVEFEEELRKYFSDELYPLYREANKFKNAIKVEATLKKAEAEHKEKVENNKFANEDEVKESSKHLEDLKRKNDSAQKDISRIKEVAKDKPVISQVLNAVKENIKEKENEAVGFKKQSTPTFPPTAEPKKENYTIDSDGKESDGTGLLTNNLVNLTNRERIMMGKVYGVIKEIMPEDKALFLIQKIEAELNKQ